MSDNSNKKISTQPYKGVRDFYPEDMFVQNHIFDTWRRVARSYGYEEYDASILEPSELYEAKSSEEIVNEQMYTFEDRGGRRVSLRPEMTPTVARMVARKKGEYPFPIRWFSVADTFRYEKPQRGRLREHVQLNVDIFGSDSIDAELELIDMSSALMTAFGASANDYIIRINNRIILDSMYERYNLDDKSAHKLAQTLDKKEKISDTAFAHAVSYLLGGNTDEFLNLIHSSPSLIETLTEKNEGIANVVSLIAACEARGIENIVFDPSLVRGFDYYTGTVFEVFDTSANNPRSLFGGGRYSKLVQSFSGEHINAAGFGCGDVVLRDFLNTYNLVPSYTPATDIIICRVEQTADVTAHADTLAHELRIHGVNVIRDISEKSVSDQITRASKKQIPYVLCIGPTEIKKETYTVKALDTGEEHTMSRKEMLTFFTS